MAYNLKQSKSKKDFSTFAVENTPRYEKEKYLRNIGLFKEEAIKDMSDEQLDEFFKVAVQVKEESGNTMEANAEYQRQKEDRKKYEQAKSEGRPAYKHHTGKVIRGRGVSFSDIYDM